LGQLSTYAKAAFPGLAALVLLWGGIHWWTLGYRSFTSYSYVVESAAPMPKAPPSILLTDQLGATWLLPSLRGKYYLMTFGYLSCGGTCPITMGEFYQISEQLKAQGRTDLALLTITLAPKWDPADSLHRVWQHYGAPEDWILATPGEGVDREAYWEQLRHMGMWVDQDRQGYPVHDNRTFLINPQGVLLRSFVGTPSLDVLDQVLLAETP